MHLNFGKHTEDAEKMWEEIPETLTENSAILIAGALQLGIRVAPPEHTQTVLKTFGNLMKAHPEHEKIWNIFLREIAVDKLTGVLAKL